MTLSSQSFSVDKEQSVLKWHAEKITGEHEGFIQLKSAELEMTDAKITKGIFVIDMTTIEVTDLSGESKKNLENHLKSDDFFGVKKHKEAKLVITQSGSLANGYAEVKGNLTIKGITNPIEFNVIRSKADDGQIFYSKITVDRTKYDIKYNSGKFFDNLGDKAIYDEFSLGVKIYAKEK
jgi:polyisoprenoid-binding protein YceI